MLRSFLGPALTLAMIANVALAYDPVPDPHYCKPGKSCKYYAAVKFVEWDQLSVRQAALISEFVADILTSGDPASAFRDWAELHDSLAATFLSVTRTLEKL